MVDACVSVCTMLCRRFYETGPHRAQCCGYNAAVSELETSIYRCVRDVSLADGAAPLRSSGGSSAPRSMLKLTSRSESAIHLLVVGRPSYKDFVCNFGSLGRIA